MTTDYVLLDHGSGGAASNALVEKVFLSRLDNKYLRTLDDSAVVRLWGKKLAVTTDSYVVDPIFFPGGNIGHLAVCGTVNDLSMQGARPLYLTLGLILEEGLPMDHLYRIVDAISESSLEAGVKIIAGDTKVVPKGKMDKIFINTAGIGTLPEGIEVGNHNARPGDVIMINGDIGDHGMTILSTREGLDFKAPLASDTAPLNSLIASILEACPDVHVLKDPTRGGLATALNEIAQQSGTGMIIHENQIPISGSVLSASEILGLDPLYMANEGKCLVIAPRTAAERILPILKAHKYGKTAEIIGEVVSENRGRVVLETRVGGSRILSMLTGEQLPRIC